jgi:OmpA-OmpF porin, OOP family
MAPSGLRRLRTWHWGLPLVVLIALAAWFAARQASEAPSPEIGTPAPRAPEAPRRAPDVPTFRAARDGERIVVSGALPSGEVRAALLEEVKQAVPNAVVSDELTVSGMASAAQGEAALMAARLLGRLPSATVVIADGAIAVAGQAPHADAYNVVVGAGAHVPAGHRLDVTGLVPPVVRPYAWSASASEEEIALIGHVPSEAARQDVRAAAARAFPDKRLVDRLQPASGVPPEVDFAAAARFALIQLAHLRAGSADLLDATLSFRGDVTDKDSLAGIKAAVQSGLPPGLRPGQVAVAVRPPSPYAFRARREAGRLILTGYYPDQAARTAIETLIGNRFFSEQVVDKLRPADGAPKNYLAGVSFGLEHLARLASGEVAVSGASIEVRGEALYEQTAEQTARAVRALSLPGWTGKAEVRLRSTEKASAEP